MGIYPVTAFNGTTIVGANVAIANVGGVHATVVSRIGILENGVKFDADGTNKANTTYGTAVCRYQVLPTSPGNAALNTAIAALEALEGEWGVLTATVDATTKTCNGRCMYVTTEEYGVATDPPAGATRKMRAFVVIEWELFSNWA